jgi:GntR family transcriptional regulator/MocR family aminotransferase
MEDSLRDHDLTVAGQGTYGGSSVWLKAPQGVDTTVLAEKLCKDSVLIEPGAPFFAGDTPPTEYLRLAYSSIPSSRIPEGIRLIANAIRYS